MPSEAGNGIAFADPVDLARTRVRPTARAALAMLPRFIRLRDAPQYLGMDKNRFNRDVRTALTAIPIGVQGIAFDRLELDAWAEDYVRRNGRPAAPRSRPWDNTVEMEEGYQDSNFAEGPGTSTKSSTESEFARALAHAISKKPKRC